MPTCIYHITHINNLVSILRSGGLIANSRLRYGGINYLDMAHDSIQERRARTPVPCSVGGFLHDYVPFYFAPRSPMLYTIDRGNVEGYAEGQTPVIHLVCEVDTIEAQGLAFAFTDGHAVMAYSDFYDDLKSLALIDWDLMDSRYWFDTADDPNRKCRRQAEFLIHQFCPWSLISKIGVINNQIQTQVHQILQNSNCSIPVEIRRDWYY